MQFDTSKKSCLHFTMFFLYRRLIFAVLICHDDYSVVLQLLPFLFSGVVLLAYILSWQPMESALFNFLANFNESMLLIKGYYMYLLTDFVPEPETRYYFGKVLLSLLYFNVAVNLVMLGIEIGNRAIFWAKVQLRPYYAKKAKERAKKLQVKHSEG